MKQETLPRLEPCKYYHIYNQGNNHCTIFYNEGNYDYFLKKYFSYLSDYVDTLCFCLLPNHFHFLIHVKEQDVIITTHLKSLHEKTFQSPQTYLEKDQWASEIVSEVFRRFFMSYSKAFNKQNNRSGSLFRKYFKRKEITNEQYLRHIIYYIHRNPWHHNISNDFTNYTWSSYLQIINGNNKMTDSKKMIDLFDNKDNFIFYHKQRLEMDEILELE